MCDWVDRSLIAGIVLLVAFMLSLPVTAPLVEYVQTSAQVEQLRVDVISVDVAESEDVVGQVTQFNQKISAMRRWNDVPVISLFVPNGWDTLAFIELPRRSAP